MAEGLAGVGNLMPIQEYDCRDHGKFPVVLSIRESVPESKACLRNIPCKRADCGGEVCEFCRPCGMPSDWVPPTVSFPGGPTTGARPPILREDNDA